MSIEMSPGASIATQSWPILVNFGTFGHFKKCYEKKNVFYAILKPPLDVEMKSKDYIRLYYIRNVKVPPLI